MAAPDRSSACREARASLASPPARAVDRDRIDAHRERCERCGGDAAEIERLRRTVEDLASVPLDELARARIHAKLGPALDELAARAAHGGADRRRKARAWSIGTAIAATLLAALLLPNLERDPRSDTVEAPALDPAIIRPYVIAGRASESAQTHSHLGGALSRLEVPARGMVRAAIGDFGRITLVGPARMTVIDPAPEDTVLGLEEGLALLQYDHAPDRRLRVIGGGVTVSVAGTVFAVEVVAGTATRVAVHEGMVDIGAGDEPPLRLGAMQAWARDSSSAGDRRAHELAALLEEHARSALPTHRASGVLILSGTPTTAAARLGGSPLGPTPLAASVPAGTVEISVTAVGYASKVMTHRIAGGETAALGFALGREPATAPAAPVGQTRSPKKRIGPRSAEAIYRLAEGALRDGDRARAERALRDLLRAHADDPLAELALFELARLAYEERASETACALLGEYLARYPNGAFAGGALARRARCDP